MKKVIITGVNGFIGSHIASHLYRKDYQIIGIDLAEKCRENASVEYIQADLSDKESVGRLMSRYGSVDAVIHTAALIDKNNENNALITANCMGTQNIIAAAKQLQCSRFLYFSSIPIIGKPLQIPILESHPVAPPTTYHATKLFGENLLLLAENASLNPCILRIPSPVGDGMNPQTILPVFLRQCRENKPISLYGKGGRRQNYLDIRDICLAAEKSLESSANGLFHIASARSYSNWELAEACRTFLDSSSDIVFNGLADPEEDYLWDISTEKAARLLHFTAVYSLEDSIRLVAETGVDLFC